MIVSYDRGASIQTVLLADSLDPASGSVQVTKGLRNSPVSSVLFYWSEGSGSNGARRAFLLNGPPGDSNWNSIYLGWNIVGIGSDVFEYEVAGFTTLP